MIIYSKCSVTCGRGSKQRTVECSRSDVSCDPTKKPTSTARCELGACPKWETGEWSAVSVSQNTLNFQPQWSLVIVPHRDLTVVQPYRKVRLSGYFCLNDSCLNASDLYRVPSFQCSVTCGDGRKQRPVSCSAGTNKCDPKTKPQSSISCNAGSCPQWKVTKCSQVRKCEHSNSTTIHLSYTRTSSLAVENCVRFSIVDVVISLLFY